MEAYGRQKEVAMQASIAALSVFYGNLKNLRAERSVIGQRTQSWSNTSVCVISYHSQKYVSKISCRSAYAVNKKSSDVVGTLLKTFIFIRLPI